MLRNWLSRLNPLKPPRSGLLVPSRARDGLAKITVKDVLHRYQNDVEALKHVSIDVHPGEFVCLLGPSGCGKSTLLYALAGHFLPSGGDITVDGKPVRGPSPERLLMFQEPALFPWLTLKQNLKFALRTRLTRKECEQKAQEFIDLVELSGFEGALPHELSGGMRMRTSLARALAMDPAVLLMDEPFGALDAQTRGQMHRLLQQIWLRSRKTVVFVTHDVREALVLADRVVVMAGRPGRILQDLEVQLPRPRDPDDDQLVQMSRQIREAIASAKGETLDKHGERLYTNGEEGHVRETTSGAGDLPAAAARPVGAGG
jgi:NitT/TauT family transport system ATP-binding protein